MDISGLVGPDGVHLFWWQECVRAVLIFTVGLTLLRLSGLRTFSRFSPLDTIVAIIIGSNLSRAMTGNAPFWPTLAAGLLFVLLHRVLAQAVLRLPGLATLFNGEPKRLMEDGVLNHDVMQTEAIT